MKTKKRKPKAQKQYNLSIDILTHEILREINREVVRTIYSRQEFLNSEEYKNFITEIRQAELHGVIKVEENADRIRGTITILRPRPIRDREIAANKLREYFERAHPKFAFHIQMGYNNCTQIDYAFNVEIKE